MERFTQKILEEFQTETRETRNQEVLEEHKMTLDVTNSVEDRTERSTTKTKLKRNNPQEIPFKGSTGDTNKVPDDSIFRGTKLNIILKLICYGAICHPEKWANFTCHKIGAIGIQMVCNHNFKKMKEVKIKTLLTPSYPMAMIMNSKGKTNSQRIKIAKGSLTNFKLRYEYLTIKNWEVI